MPKTDIKCVWRISVSCSIYSNPYSNAITASNSIAGTAVQSKLLFQLGTEPRKGLLPDFETTKHSNEVDLIYILTMAHKCTP